MAKKNSRWAVNLTALVLAVGLLMGLFTGCPNGSGPNRPNESAQPNGQVQPTDPSIFETDGNGTITGYKCAKDKLPAHLVIPAKIGGEVIREIKWGAFRGCTGLRSIDLSACTSLTTIGWEAFKGCTGLTSITLPASLTRIGESAFDGCKGLTSAVFADKNNWKVYDDEAHTQNETEIGSSDLDNVATAAKYLRENTYHGGYIDKYWKKQ